MHRNLPSSEGFCKLALPWDSEPYYTLPFPQESEPFHLLPWSFSEESEPPYVSSYPYGLFYEETEPPYTIPWKLLLRIWPFDRIPGGFPDPEPFQLSFS